MHLIKARLRISTHASIALLMILAFTSLIGLDLRQCWVAHETRLSDARTETANLARSIAAHVSDTFKIVDSVLLGLDERVSVDGTGPATIARLERLMRARVANQDTIRGLFLIDEHGAWLANSVPGSSHDVNYANRDYFRYHQASADTRPRINKPVRSKLDRSWVIPVTQRINHPDGSFAGVLSVTIATEIFQSNFQSFDIGDGGIITMTNGGHVVMVRRPFDELNVGRDITSAPTSHLLAPEARARSVEYLGAIEHDIRIGSLYRVPGYDLIVIVSRSKDEVLTEWWRQTEFHLTWIGLAVLALALLLWRKAVMRRATARTEALYRLLADNSSDAILCTDRQGQRKYVSPAFWTMTGWTEAELLGKPWSDIVLPEDRPKVQAMFDTLMAGSQVCAEYRYLRPDGTSVWVELLARPTADPLGGPPVFVGNIRNISRQKAVEIQLEAINTELAAMSLTDPLTGVANRRHFDATLRKEWNRAMRDGTCIALMMADADHFKAYNDLYGHVRGDECLRAIAVMLAGGIRRPGDLAARYGGEEFAVILPGTSGEAAAAMANQLRQTLADQGLEHAGNHPGIVTISIGVAAMVPLRGEDPEVLIRLADETLYEAKRTGRNRVACASRETGSETAGHAMAPAGSGG